MLQWRTTEVGPSASPFDHLPIPFFRPDSIIDHVWRSAGRLLKSSMPLFLKVGGNSFLSESAAVRSGRHAVKLAPQPGGKTFSIRLRHLWESGIVGPLRRRPK